MARIAQIASTARYLPERVITNAHLASRLPAGGNASLIDKFASATGILQRYCVPDDWATSDLALPAAKEALKRAGRKPEDVSLIILGTDSPDYITPDTSVVLQHKIGAKNSGTFDVGCACASFPACLAIASGLIATNPDLKTVLVIGVYLMRKLADPDDPVCFFYGDGAGAAVLEGGDLPGFVGAAFQADGSYATYWGTFSPAAPRNRRAWSRQIRAHESTAAPNLSGQAQRGRLAAAVQAPRGENGFAADDVDQLMLTQVNKPRSPLWPNAAASRLRNATPSWRSTATPARLVFAMALDDAIELGKIKRGDLVVMIGSGVGYNMAAAAIRMTV